MAAIPSMYGCIGCLWTTTNRYTVIVKHAGKRHEVELDPTSNGETLKYQLFSLTGVEPDRQKVLVKGGQLKDDTPLSALNAKPGQMFMTVSYTHLTLPTICSV